MDRGYQKNRKPPPPWPRPKRSDAILVLVLFGFAIAAKAVMSWLEVLDGGVSSSPSHMTSSQISTWQITILILTSQANWETQAAAIKDTWLSEPLPLGVRYFWVTDEAPPGEPAIVVSNRLRPGLPAEPLGANNERVVQALIRVLKEAPSRWYIKVDDDTYVNPAAVTPQSLATLTSPEEQPYYVGDCACSWEQAVVRCNASEYFDCSVFQRLWDQSEGGYACGGAGYLLSYAAVKRFVEYEQEEGAVRGAEDMMIGEAMQRHLGTSCMTPSSGSFAMVTLGEGASAGAGFELAHASNRSLGTLHRADPERMRSIHEQVQPKKTVNV